MADKWKLLGGRKRNDKSVRSIREMMKHIIVGGKENVGELIRKNLQNVEIEGQ